MTIFIASLSLGSLLRMHKRENGMFLSVEPHCERLGSSAGLAYLIAKGPSELICTIVSVLMKA
jgi:hypothetical protein